MNRKHKILKYIDPEGFGVEIGPSHNPIAPKRDGFKTHVIDHMSRKQLLGKYKNHGVNLDNIEEVDFVWEGQPYAELLGSGKKYDWIIASHVIEHTPDLIGFLLDCDSILNDDGVISLAIPDKRYCFDRFRPITGLSDIVNSHAERRSIHSPGTVAEYYLNVVSKGGDIAWSPGQPGRFKFIHAPSEARSNMENAGANSAYADLHAWCFVPSSFRLLIHDLHLLGLTPMREVMFFPTSGCEFFATLGRRGSGPAESRLTLLRRVERESGFRISGANSAGFLRGLAKQLFNSLRRPSH